MANYDPPIWNYGLTTSTSTSLTWPVTVFPITSTYPVPVPSAGHIPSYEPPALAEDELSWLRRRVTEVTDLFPAAA